MSNLSVACSMLLFAHRGIKFREMCRTLQRLGYKGVELVPGMDYILSGDSRKKVRDLTPEDAQLIREVAGSFDLTITGFQQIFRGLDAERVSLTSNDPQIRNAAIKELTRLIDLCGLLGGNIVGIGSPAHRRVPKGGNPSDCFDLVIEAIETATGRSTQDHVRLLIEPLSPDCFISTPQEGLQISEAVGLRRCGYLYDTAAAHTQHCGALGVLEQLLNISDKPLAHVHFRDPNGLLPISQLDYAAALGLLKQHKYAGWVTIEPVFAEDADQESLPKAEDHAEAWIQMIMRCMPE